jgi:S-phase kinase-associated protein 1
MQSKVHITLLKDESEFDVPDTLIGMMPTIKEAIEDTESNSIPVDHIDSKIFGLILEYITYHTEHPNEDNAEEPSPGKKYREWDTKFIQGPESGVRLLDLVNAANYLAVTRLVYLGCWEAARRIKGKSVEEMREFFGVTSDFTKEEEEQLKKEIEWLNQK